VEPAGVLPSAGDDTGSPLFDADLVDPDGLKATLAEIGRLPWDEEFHAKLLQVCDLHLAAVAYL
jgi:hypothetical protein